MFLCLKLSVITGELIRVKNEVYESYSKLRIIYY